jgi:hypothetical protein
MHAKVEGRTRQEQAPMTPESSTKDIICSVYSEKILRDDQAHTLLQNFHKANNAKTEAAPESEIPDS